jgi:hypothetical protein
MPDKAHLFNALEGSLTCFFRSRKSPVRDVMFGVANCAKYSVRHPELDSGSIVLPAPIETEKKWMLNQVQHDDQRIYFRRKWRE